jgi:phosphoribosylamine--glycine ligase
MAFPMNASDKSIVLLGGGAREHALAEKLTRDGATVHVLPGNAGIPNSHPEVNPLDFPAVRAYCEQVDAKLIVVGPEAPLAAGVTDFFADTDIKVFGPTRAAAMLESSKVWSKDFMRRHGVATAQAWQFRSDSIAAARAKAAQLNGQVVVKYDGLAAGKGVYVCSSIEEAEAALTDLQAQHSGWFSFLLEEKLVGPEISIIGLTDGHEIKLLAPSQDHKQLLAGDQGPNTGGMGAYCPVPFCDDNVLAAIRRDIIDPTLYGLQNEQFRFRGFLYFGIMLTATGPKLLEYNVRLGDPEAEVLLPALDSSLLELIEATLNGSLARQRVRQKSGYFVGVVLASGGYPAAQFPTGFPITGLDNLPREVRAFHGATRRDEAGQLVTNGGRVLVLTAAGPDLEVAVARAYEACARVSFQDVYFRPDIAQRPELSGEMVN